MNPLHRLYRVGLGRRLVAAVTLDAREPQDYAAGILRTRQEGGQSADLVEAPTGLPHIARGRYQITQRGIGHGRVFAPVHRNTITAIMPEKELRRTARHTRFVPPAYGLSAA